MTPAAKKAASQTGQIATSRRHGSHVCGPNANCFSLQVQQMETQQHLAYGWLHEKLLEDGIHVACSPTNFELACGGARTRCAHPAGLGAVLASLVNRSRHMTVSDRSVTHVKS